MKKAGLLLFVAAIAGCDTQPKAESFMCSREYNGRPQTTWELFIDYENRKLRVGPEDSDYWVEADFDGLNPNKITWEMGWLEAGGSKDAKFSFDKRSRFLTYDNNEDWCVSR